MTRPLSAHARSDETSSEIGRLEPLSGDALAVALNSIDWSESPCDGLGRIMARRDVDLATALCVFFRGAPERFNYLPKPHVPDGYRAVARHLDNICLRINSGFYLPQPDGRLGCRDTLDRWLDYQRADRQEGRCGRWVLDEAVLMPLFDSAWYCEPRSHHRERDAPSLWHAILGSLRDLRGPRAFMRLRK
ncbi:hypothetical protein [Roseovarius nitratireducens]|uniref:hypothetical protein n=1 Tax=Roseovarius nitratireducens TaxID=2044597 RepID=UPI00101AE1DF|nr:hypothetical protein [Roseovarius nitratireducens]